MYPNRNKIGRTLVQNSTLMSELFISIFALFFTLIVTETPAVARERLMLDKAVENSYRERAGVETSHREEGKLSRKIENTEMRTLDVEIGDELGGDGDEGEPSAPKHLSSDQAYQETGGTKNLDKEWKEVNRSMRASKAASFEKTSMRKGGASRSRTSGKARGSSTASAEQD